MKSLLCITIAVTLAFTSCTNENRQPAEELEGWRLVEREVLGENLYGGPTLHGNTMYFTFIENIRHGHGYGENFTLWRRDLGENAWEKRPLFPEHQPGMSSLLPLDDSDLLFMYVNRVEEENRRVHLVRVEEDTEIPLFELGQERESGNPGVLNPRMDLMSDGNLHLLIPDRTDRFVRRFIVDPETGQEQRLSDIETPRVGARIYGRLMENDRLLVPLAVVNELLLLVIDLTDHSYEVHSLDTFTSKSNEPPRSISMYRLENPDQYLVSYFRPAAFSDRSGRQGERTGLVGEVVLRVLETDSFETVESTVIAGFTPEKASTHNVPRTQVGPRDFLFAFTTVDRIHVRHLTGRYENYTGASMSRWHIRADGTPEIIFEEDLSPFYSASLQTMDDGKILFTYKDATSGASRILDLMELVD